MSLPIEISALHRLGFGFRAQDLTYIQKIGFKNYLKEQLNPDESKEDAGLLAQLADFKILVEYEHKGKKVRQNRSFSHLSASPSELWKLTQNDAWEEKMLPAFEVYIATWLRAISSRWQLRELLVSFWHNHFNVSIDAHEVVAITLPTYDQMVIRKHVLGNFRSFLEAVAQSPTMLYYLDNVYNKASPANENYARELFELHTLGADNYVNHLYNRWREVPKSLDGKPIGYIDEDVYEAARAFTGWTVANGAYSDNGNLENTGSFLYHDAWHDNYQKRVLGVEFDPNQPKLADGLKVLDLVAFHPATARHICTKLCRKLVSDSPPETLIQKAVEIWMANQQHPEQIKLVVESILLSNEFEQSSRQKIKNPMEWLTSFFRATNCNPLINKSFYYLFQRLGYRVFTWQTPTGNPDKDAYWLSANMLVQKWNMLAVLLLEDWHKILDDKLLAALPTETTTAAQIVAYWEQRFWGYPLPEKQREILENFLAEGGSTAEDIVADGFLQEQKLRNLLHLIALSPDFQYK